MAIQRIAINRIPGAVFNRGISNTYFKKFVQQWLGQARQAPPQAITPYFDRLYLALSMTDLKAHFIKMNTIREQIFNQFQELGQSDRKRQHARKLLAEIYTFFKTLADDQAAIDNIVDHPGAMAALHLETLPEEEVEESCASQFQIEDGPILRLISPKEFQEKWNTVCLGAGDTWVDIGSGDAVTTITIARRFPEASIIGLDMDRSSPVRREIQQRCPHFCQSPSNLSYYLFSERTHRVPGVTNVYDGTLAVDDTRVVHQRLRQRTYERVPEHSADLVSLLFPSDGIYPDGFDHFLYLCETALSLLQPGGQGFIVSASYGCLERGLRFFAEHLKPTATVAYVELPLATQQLSSMGIQPYELLFGDTPLLEIVPPAHHLLSCGIFNWAFGLHFTV